MNEQKNLLLCLVLAFICLFGFHYFYERPKLEAIQHQQQLEKQALVTEVVASSTTSLSREQALGESPRLLVKTQSLQGTIPLKGGFLDDLALKRYQETPEPNSSTIKLLSPKNSSTPYYVEFCFYSADPKVKVPTADAIWQVKEGEKLTAETPVTLYWDNGQGAVFERVYAVDENYLFTVTHRVINKTGNPLRLTPYSVITRSGTPETSGTFILHEGALGVINGQLKEVDYKDLAKKGTIQAPSTGGWLGFTDKYWLTALVPLSESQVTTRFRHQKADKTDYYQIELIHSQIDISPAQAWELKERIFAGAKEVHLLDQYEKEQGIARFDLAVDFGWFYFLTKPIFYILSKLHEVLGNFGISILVLTVLIKLLLFPLANKSYRSMAKMKQLQPELMKLREQYSDDRLKLNEAMMGLYKKYQVSPLAGCLPIIIQIPVFFALYKVLFVTLEMRHAPFFGWIKDLSAPDPTTIFNLFGLIPWNPPSFLHIGVWPILMGITMILQQRLNPQPADPIQARIFMFMPIAFTVLLSQFSAGLVIYWAWNNILSIGQQWLIMQIEKKKPLKVQKTKTYK